VGHRGEIEGEPDGDTMNGEKMDAGARRRFAPNLVRHSSRTRRHEAIRTREARQLNPPLQRAAERALRHASHTSPVGFGNGEEWCEEWCGVWAAWATGVGQAASGGGPRAAGACVCVCSTATDLSQQRYRPEASSIR
jgi:hypothetical protein